MQLPSERLPISDESLDRFFTTNGRIGLLYGNASLTRVALYGVTLATIAGQDVIVIDGANSFDAYFVARLVRRWNYAPESILSHIRLSRAFTCYQLSESITQRLPSAIQSAWERHCVGEFGSPMPHQRTSIFCIGLLDTFYDEDVPMSDAMRLLKAIITTLVGLARHGHPVFITARELRRRDVRRGMPKFEDRSTLIDLLLAAATHTKRIDALNPNGSAAPTQLQLIVA